MSKLPENVLITGGAGMLAQALVRAMRARGIHPIVLDRQQLDITDALSVRSAFEHHRPEVVLNCAAFTKVDLCEQEPDQAHAVNAKGVENLASAAALHGTRRFVHFSTDFVFDGTARTPYPVDAPVHPLSVYGASKLAGERAIEAIGSLDWLILRTAWLYGPGGPCFPQTMINAARAAKPLKVVDDQVGSPTFTHDLADATLNLLEAGAPRGVYHVVNAGQTSWFEFTRAILEEFGLRTELSPTTSAQWKRLRPASAIRPAYSVLDTSRYTNATGRSMRPWRDALKEYRHVLQPE